MWVRLVTRVPDHSIRRQGIRGIHRHRQFDGAEVGAKMPAGLADIVQDSLTNFSSKFDEFLVTQFVEISRIHDPAQKPIRFAHRMRWGRITHLTIRTAKNGS